MNRISSRFQNGCRRLLRPIARVVRRALTPPEPPLEFVWQRIEAGPAAGSELLLPRGTALSAAITSGTYEQQVLAFVQALVRPNDVCFDIGGHYGYYTLALAKLASGGQVHTFEPVTEHARRIEQASRRSGLDHVTVHPVAVAGAVGTMTLHYAAGEGADDSMAYLGDYGGVDTEAAREHYQRFSRTTVDTVTLDRLVDRTPPPRLIKIDAEGAEGPILNAGRELIAAARPRLLIEVHGIYEALHCAEILDQLNYRAILLSEQKTTLPILWAPRDDDEALAAVGGVLGRQPTVLFDAALRRAQPDRRDESSLSP
jgi:FkbM family methyltransferase